MLKNEDGFIKIAAPILLVLLYGCLYDRIGCLATTILFTKYSPPLGFMRSFADITAGCVCYRIYEWMDDLELPGEELLATLVEIGVLLASFLYMYSNMSEVDFLFVPLFMAFVISVFRGKSLLSKMLDNPISEWLGRQTFAFFLNNAFIVYVCMFLFPGADVWSMCFFCVPACLIFSFITGTLIGTNKPRSRRI